MGKILFIDACVREHSRTRELAQFLLDRLHGEIEHIELYHADLYPIDRERLLQREKCCSERNFRDKYFDYAKQFSSADEIVIAAPFWDNSFPARLKQYIETICVCGLTFEYTAEGMPKGLCRAKRLHYVTTAGGSIINNTYGFGYICDLASGMFGIPESFVYSAEGLDIVGADTELIIRNAKKRIINHLETLL